MFAYRTPGVYFDWLDQRTPPLAPLRTDVAGFVGVAAGGPLHVPVRIESLTQFVSIFGGHSAQGHLAYAVEGFFANGGRTCWVVRAADPAKAAPASFMLRDEEGKDALRLSAVVRVASSDGTARRYANPGAWGRRVRFTLAPTARDRFTLIVRLGSAREIWRDLSLDPADARYAPRLVNDERAGSGLVEAVDQHSKAAAPANTPSAAASGLRGGEGRLRGGADGLLTLKPDHLSGEGAPAGVRWGLEALAQIDEVSIVAVPDIMPPPPAPPGAKRPRPHDCSKLDPEDLRGLYGEPPWPTPEACVPEPADADDGDALPGEDEAPPEFAEPFGRDAIFRLQTALVVHCERLKDRVCVLDTHPADLTPEAVLRWRRDFTGEATKFAALYFPWLRVPDPLGPGGTLRDVPPSGHVAGVYARGDLRTGVHKPPANEELEGVKDVRVPVGDVEHGELNEGGVNCIREYAGRGLRVAGARTLYRGALWRYVNVRRLLTMIEEVFDEQTQWTVFEPNTPDLWRQVDRVARTFLLDLWRRGMLDGATPDDAFSVRCDAETNPPAEVEAGRMTCELGVRPPWPAEFVVVRIGKTEGATEISEGAGGPG